jgi:hypothetical protein
MPMSGRAHPGYAGDPDLPAIGANIRSCRWAEAKRAIYR